MRESNSQKHPSYWVNKSGQVDQNQSKKPVSSVPKSTFFEPTNALANAGTHTHKTTTPKRTCPTKTCSHLLRLKEKSDSEKRLYVCRTRLDTKEGATLGKNASQVGQTSNPGLFRPSPGLSRKLPPLGWAEVKSRKCTSVPQLKHASEGVRGRFSCRT